MRRFILISLIGLGAWGVTAPSKRRRHPPTLTASTHAFVPTDGRTDSARYNAPRSATDIRTASSGFAAAPTQCKPVPTGPKRARSMLCREARAGQVCY